MSIRQSSLLRAACIALCFSACVSSSITSNKSDSLKGPFKKIFMVPHTDVIVEPFTGPLIDNIKNDFARRNIDLMTEVMIEKEKGSLSLDPASDNENINTEINKFQPQAVLFMSVTKIETYTGVISGRGSNGATFDLRLFESGDPKTPGWRASYVVYGNSGISMAVKKGTRTLLAKLEDDNIILHRQTT